MWSFPSPARLAIAICGKGGFCFSLNDKIYNELETYNKIELVRLCRKNWKEQANNDYESGIFKCYGGHCNEIVISK